MSAQASPLTPTNEKINALSTSKDAIELSVSKQTEDMTLTELDTNPEIDASAEETSASEENPEKTNQEDSSFVEVEALQQAILEDENFDFSTLDSPAAGTESPISPLETEESLLAPSPISENSHSALNYYADDSPGSNGPDVPNTTISSPLIEDNEIANTTTNIGQLDISTTEDLSTQITGKIDSDFVFKNANTDTNYGNISYNSDGEWTFTLNNNATPVQALGEGDQLQESIVLETKGGSTFTLDLTINGANDKAEITGSVKSDIQTLSNTDQSTIKSNGDEVLVQVSGKLFANDIDQGENIFQEDSELSCTFGTASIDTEGNWVYTLDHESDAVKALISEGNHLLDFFSVESIDGTKQQIKVTIQGADDTPVISTSDNLAEIDLSISTSSSGYLPISDPDFNQSTFIADNNIQGKFGFGFGSINEKGEWSYEINTNNAQVTSLEQGENLTDIIFVQTKDGTQFEIIAKIQGSDSPVFSTTSDEELLSSLSPEHSTVSLNSLIANDTSESEVNTMLSSTFDNTNSNTPSSSQKSESSDLSNGNSESEILLHLTQDNNLDLV